MHRLPRRRLNQHTQASIEHISDRTEIILVVDEIDNTVDAKEWERCRSYFTDDLYADKLSHHMRTNHRVTVNGDKAEVFSIGYALNILRRRTGSDLWEVWGN